MVMRSVIMMHNYYCSTNDERGLEMVTEGEKLHVILMCIDKRVIFIDKPSGMKYLLPLLKPYSSY